MNNDLVTYLQRRIEESTKKLQSISEQVQQLNGQREILTGDIDGYKRTLLAETRGTIGLVESEQDDVPFDAVESVEPNKAEFARKFIRGRAHSGVTPVDILQGFDDAGIQISKPYVYALVQRLRKQNAIYQRRGRWYPAESSQNGAVQ